MKNKLLLAFIGLLIYGAISAQDTIRDPYNSSYIRINYDGFSIISHDEPQIKPFDGGIDDAINTFLESAKRQLGGRNRYNEINKDYIRFSEQKYCYLQDIDRITIHKRERSTYIGKHKKEYGYYVIKFRNPVTDREDVLEFALSQKSTAENVFSALVLLIKNAKGITQ
ncbi:MAG: hypothetical protein LBG17_00245 [Bacteroidales bacterium]|jgi:hypothetical protein|nr:hypothetical protein [Bacteroidales bacterium]